MPKETPAGDETRRSLGYLGWSAPRLIYLVMSRVEILHDGEVDLVYNPVSGTLAHAAGHTKELPGCILGEKTFLSGVRTPEPTMGPGIVWIGLSRDMDILTLAGGSHLVID